MGMAAFVSYSLDPDTLHKPSETLGAEMGAVPPAPALELLWSFSCELTVGQSVSSMAWNKNNPVQPLGFGSKLHCIDQSMKNVILIFLQSRIF